MMIQWSFCVFFTLLLLYIIGYPIMYVVHTILTAYYCILMILNITVQEILVTQKVNIRTAYKLTNRQNTSTTSKSNIMKPNKYKGE